MRGERAFLARSAFLLQHNKRFSTVGLVEGGITSLCFSLNEHAEERGVSTSLSKRNQVLALSVESVRVRAERSALNAVARLR